MELTMDESGQTFSEFINGQLFDHVAVGDEIAIRQDGDVDWWHGKVASVETPKTAKTRTTRMQEHPTLDVECHAPMMRRRTFYHDGVKALLFKDGKRKA